MKNPLDERERQSPIWKKIETLLNEELNLCRKKNDADIDPTRTANLRGRIRVIKDLLAPRDEKRVADE